MTSNNEPRTAPIYANAEQDTSRQIKSQTSMTLRDVQNIVNHPDLQDKLDLEVRVSWYPDPFGAPDTAFRLDIFDASRVDFKDGDEAFILAVTEID